MEAVIQTEGLTKRFGTRTAVDGLDLVVPAGCVFGFLGPNGAGKTTTIGMLLGLVRPSAGRALVLGHDVQAQPERALAGVGAMIEAPAFYPYLSGCDNLRALTLAEGLPAARAAAALAEVGLAERAGDKFRTYSQGMRQRLGIAAALLADPQLIILDEPTNGLDPAGQIEIHALLRTLAGRGRTIFLSSHILHDVEQICDQVAILKQGRLVAAGPVAELLRRGQGVQMRVVGQAARAAELLRSTAWVRGVAQRGDELQVDAPPERAAELNMLLSGQGIPVSEVRAGTGSLEELFLEVTGDGERGRGGDASERSDKMT